MDRRDTPLERMEVLTDYDEERRTTHISIAPAYSYRHRISIEQSQRFIVGGWQTIVYWTGGSSRDENPGAFLDAFQEALRLRDVLWELHPDGSL